MNGDNDIYYLFWTLAAGILFAFFQIATGGVPLANFLSSVGGI